MRQGKLETRPLGQRVTEAESTHRSEFEDMSDAELERSLDLSRTWQFLDRTPVAAAALATM
jgi:hypothetical protein